MYKAIVSGSFNGYRFDAGQTVNAPKGSLDGCHSLIWIGEPEPVKTEPENTLVIPSKARSVDYTVAEAKKMMIGMTPEQVKAFLEGETRKSLK